MTTIDTTPLPTPPPFVDEYRNRYESLCGNLVPALQNLDLDNDEIVELLQELDVPEKHFKHLLPREVEVELKLDLTATVYVTVTVKPDEDVDDAVTELDDSDILDQLDVFSCDLDGVEVVRYSDA